MATHSIIIALKKTWTEEPGELQSIGVTKNQTRLTDCLTHTHTHTLTQA